MGLDPALVAGAILSGAIFGDKMSPLSDSTNLASAVAGSELFAHIKNMMWTTIPAFLISLIGFLALGHASKAPDMTRVNETINILEQHFTINWWASLPIILMFVCAWCKIPAIPTLFINIFVSTVMIFINEPHFTIKQLASLVETGFVAQNKKNADETHC